MAISDFGSPCGAPLRPGHSRVPDYLWNSLLRATPERRLVVRLECLAASSDGGERLGKREVLEALDAIDASEVEAEIGAAASAAVLLISRFRGSKGGAA